MGKFDGVLLATDFDDTLFRSNVTGPGVSEKEKRSEPVVFGRNKAALEYFFEQGGLFTVATGRDCQTFMPYKDRVPMNAPAVLANGAVIYDCKTDRELFHDYLPDTIVGDVKRLAEEMPELGFECHLGEVIYTYRPNEISFYHIHKLGCAWKECAFEEMPAPWTKLLVQHPDHEVLVKAQEWFEREYDGVYEAIFSNRKLLEVTVCGANKGGAVLRVAELMGVKKENIYCVGDNQNDIPMLAVAAQGFAPANCAKAVRDWGATVVCDCEDGAIADVIEILDKQYQG